MKHHSAHVLKLTHRFNKHNFIHCIEASQCTLKHHNAHSFEASQCTLKHRSALEASHTSMARHFQQRGVTWAVTLGTSVVPGCVTHPVKATSATEPSARAQISGGSWGGRRHLGDGRECAAADSGSLDHLWNLRPCAIDQTGPN